MDTIDTEVGIDDLVEFFKKRVVRFTITFLAGVGFGYLWSFIVYGGM